MERDGIKINDITSNQTNQEIIHRLKKDDPKLKKLTVCAEGARDGYCYYPEGARDLGWLGYYIGRNTILKELHLRSGFNGGIHFCRGVNCNRSIRKFSFCNMDLLGGEIFQLLSLFFENNHNLSEISVGRCTFGAGCAQQLSLALRCCNKSLKSIELDLGEWLIDILPALRTHSQLEKLALLRMEVGRNGCTAIANLLQLTFTQLHVLDLRDNDIDDEAVDILVGVLNIDNEGVDALVDALPNSRLQSLNLVLLQLDLSRNNIRPEDVRVLQLCWKIQTPT